MASVSDAVARRCSAGCATGGNQGSD